MLRRLARNESGAGAAEFGLILPIFLLFLFGIIDVGGYAWAINRGEKATQMGARMAAVTDPVASGMKFSYVGKTIGGVVLQQGDVIPADSMVITCTSTACSCTGCPTEMTVALDTSNPKPFDNVVARMQDFEPSITAANVEVLYRASGLGYAGDPAEIEIAPMITVRLKDRTYSPFTLFLIKAALPLPSSSYSLTMEDGSGQVSN